MKLEYLNKIIIGGWQLAEEHSDCKRRFESPRDLLRSRFSHLRLCGYLHGRRSVDWLVHQNARAEQRHHRFIPSTYPTWLCWTSSNQRANRSHHRPVKGAFGLRDPGLGAVPLVALRKWRLSRGAGQLKRTQASRETQRNRCNEFRRCALAGDSGQGHSYRLRPDAILGARPQGDPQARAFDEQKRHRPALLRQRGGRLVVGPLFGRTRATKTFPRTARLPSTCSSSRKWAAGIRCKACSRF